MRKLCIIPARGGSKRIPHKNIVDFYGKPLIWWTIEAALHARVFDTIYVSTDDGEIADQCWKFPIEIIMRNGYSDDQTTVQQATIQTIKQIEEERRQKFDMVTQLMPTCPLRTAMDIKLAYENFITNYSNFQLSFCEFAVSPYWAVKLDHDKPKPLFPKQIKMRSQDLQKLYYPTGAIWIANIKELIKQGTFYGKGYDMYEIDRTHGIDIDTFQDLEYARKLMEAK